MYRTRNLIQLIRKSTVCTVPSPHIVELLKERTLIRISGHEASEYLQGLITNDVHHIDHGGCMYSMFLNTKGRVMYDAIIYKTDESGTFLIECDTEVAASLEKHLKIYRLRKKIDIVPLLQECDVYALFNPEIVRLKKEKRDAAGENIDGAVVGCDTLNETLPDNITTTRTFKDMLIYRDPRISLLGSRVIAPKNSNIIEQLSQICILESSSKVGMNYRWLRYTLGVGEGTRDLPPGNCFPLEANCDYLHGVSFHKGCYIGQEVTARTHHTGIVRKRLMPLHFAKVPGKIPENENVVQDKVNLGKLRGIEGDSGLALLRIAKCLDLKEINIGDGIACTDKPSWWPVEASKERISVQRNE